MLYLQEKYYLCKIDNSIINKKMKTEKGKSQMMFLDY